MKYGYARVSSSEQETALQRDALQRAGVVSVFEEKRSAVKRRPVLAEVLAKLEPGDTLYLPPGWAHDGVAEGECLTASIGFRAPGRDQLGRELLQRLLDDAEPAPAERLYRDPKQAATAAPGPSCIPLKPP